jgi:hypothetical protein
MQSQLVKQWFLRKLEKNKDDFEKSVSYMCHFSVLFKNFMCKNTRVLLMNTLSTFFCTVLGMVEKDIDNVNCNMLTICASECLTFWVCGKDVCIYKEVPVSSF